jgi:hypothetical protein
MRAMARGLLQPSWKQKDLSAFLTQQGYSTSLDVVKQAKKRGDLTLGGLTHLSDEELTFARSLYHQEPEISLDRLVEPTSPAETALLLIKEKTQNVDHP